ncbi:MAG: HlyD family efflux transporter periplasmic adaptor subunit [Hydrococcus sp. SU_1_0]|nr:HlyD family efflux transporter periplasmic adaptor subunit [Hydrococcus sp. SU_1_0]NJO97859.1 HlyD family efflux transporter periplasmic adaptor subunit [Pleurocapsa sp. CRU_1_2]
MKVKPKAVEVAPEAFEIESEAIGVALEGTEIIPAKQSAVSEKDIATLNNYADKKYQETTQLSEVMDTVPSIVQRGGIYLISAAVGLTSVLLYFSKVPVWIESPGNIVPEADNIFITTATPGIVTAVKAKVGQQLAKDSTLLEIKPTDSNNPETVTPQQAQTWQALQQKELEITQSKIQLAKLQMQFMPQAKDDADTNAQALVSLTAKIKNLEAEVASIKAKLENPLPSVANNRITMPQAGIVSQLKVNKPGELIAQDTLVATVIPDTNRLTVETLVSDRDLAALKPGMTARIKVNAYDFRQFGTIPAQITEIIHNLDRPGEFKVVLNLLPSKLTYEDQKVDLSPGLNVQVEIAAGKKRLSEILFSKQ